MSMHILPAYYTTTVSKRKLSRKATAKSKLVSDHDRWLLSKGLHPDQIKSKKDKKSLDLSFRKGYNESMVVDRSTRHYDNKKLVAGDCSKRDIMTNLHKEPEHVQKEILKKASLVMPLYNKGGLQYAGPDVDLTTVGTKSRRG
jgi:hypothetical protein